MSKYFTASESRQYAFFRIPKELMLHPFYHELGTDAKLLYGMFLDRMELSERNQWLDENGRVYIYFSVEEIMEMMGCGNQKVSKLMKELEQYELIERKRQGMGNPSRIYVKNFIRPTESHDNRCENHTSCDVESTSTEVCKSHVNNIEKNKTEKSKIHPSDPMGCDAAAERADLSEYLRDSLGIEALLHDRPYEKDTILGIWELVLDTCSSKRKTIRVSGEDRPAEVVRSRLMKLSMGHVQYVLDCMKENTTNIRDIRQYLLAALYQAPITMDSYYRAKVNYHQAYGT